MFSATHSTSDKVLTTAQGVLPVSLHVPGVQGSAVGVTIPVGMHSAPSGHGVQLVAPSLALYVPVSHGTHGAE